MSDPNSPIPLYFHFLAEAAKASEDVDNFDNDDDNNEEFVKLCEIQKETSNELINHIIKHGAEILSIINL